MDDLSKDPYNIIITGVGGQGNVTASRILGNMLVPPYTVTVGETFGASQRGGSVMSHVRVSQESAWSPQIPLGKADLIVALEPVEALRVLAAYGNPDTRIIVNTRPVYPAEDSPGEVVYPSLDRIRTVLEEVTDYVWFLPATDVALHHLKAPVLGNVIILGAVAGLHVVPVTKSDFTRVISRIFSQDKVAANVKAFEMGIEMVT